MKIITYNVNGIRAAMNKGLVNWLKQENPDVICFQELKANPDQFNVNEFSDLGYHPFWYPAQKKGYSGVGILAKEKPNNVEYGCGIKIYDDEGRVLRADFKNFSVMSVYHPSGSSGDERQAFKMKWLGDYHNYINKLKTKIPNLILSGDFNICHRAIDIHNPVSNAGTSGFLPEEREWMEQFLNSGFIDSFRSVNKNPHQYTWWSFRANSRAKNLGWRIDYNMVAQPLEKNISSAHILPQAMHSDHCPAVLELSLKN